LCEIDKCQKRTKVLALHEEPNWDPEDEKSSTSFRHRGPHQPIPQ
jgi:hypothetical protein